MAGMTPNEGGMFSSNTTNSAFKKQLNKVYTWYTGGFIAFVCVLAVAEQMGLTRAWIGYIFLAATVLLYAGIGVMSRTNDAAEYYVAGRRVPALYNGMATGADWMSAASFIGMAGTLYLTGYSGRDGREPVDTRRRGSSAAVWYFARVPQWHRLSDLARSRPSPSRTKPDLA